jgi:hypothetical protein
VDRGVAECGVEEGFWVEMIRNQFSEIPVDLPGQYNHVYCLWSRQALPRILERSLFLKPMMAFLNPRSAK